MKIVADTNVFLAVAMNEPEKKGIIQVTVGHQLLAPEVLPFEVGNALTAMVKRRSLEARLVQPTWASVQAIPVELRKIDIPSALEIACRFNIYAYDAYFLECALSCRSPLLTLDSRLGEVAGSLGIHLLELPR